ncbi:hypothetical protein STEG23_033914 [Scotinomys teguina]
MEQRENAVTETHENLNPDAGSLSYAALDCVNETIRSKTTGQKRAPDLAINGCEPLCGYWELNSGPLEEQLINFGAISPAPPALFLVEYTGGIFP